MEDGGFWRLTSMNTNNNDVTRGIIYVTVQSIWNSIFIGFNHLLQQQQQQNTYNEPKKKTKETYVIKIYL